MDDTQTITAMIVDDEALSRQKVRRMLKPHSDVQIVAECTGGEDAVEVLQKTRPDLLFLDVQMPDLDGFGVLESLDTLPVVIFITAYDRYALRAFEVHAVDYLLKPFDSERFEEALSRAKKMLAQDEESDIRKRLLALLKQMNEENPKQQYLQKIAIKDEERVFFLDVRQIDWIEAHSKAIYFHVGAQSHYLRGSLVDLEASLDPMKFVRINRGSLVNLDRIAQLNVLPHGDCRLTLQSGVKLLLSRRYKKRLNELLHL